MIKYLASLRIGKIILWCYLLWYITIVIFYFDPSARIWLNSAGISIIIGFALKLSVSPSAKPDKWQTFRLFAMPFGVSSFSALIKNKGFYLVAPPRVDQISIAVGICMSFVLLVFAVKYACREKNG